MNLDIYLATIGIAASLLIGMQVRRTRKMWEQAKQLPREVDHVADEVTIESHVVRSKIRAYKDAHEDPLSALVREIHHKKRVM